MLNYVDIDSVQIPFDSTWKKISVSSSGGADSTLLLYLLCDHITRNNLDIEIHVINHVRCWKTKPWQEYDAIKIFKHVSDIFSNLKFQRHVNFIPPEMEWGNAGPTMTDEYGKTVSGDNIELRAFAEYICYKFDIPVYFNAVTRNPKAVDFQGMPTRDIDPNDDNEHLLLMKHMDKWACHPFRFTEKNWIINQYRRLGIVDLFELTRSCEGEVEGIDYKNYTPYQPVPICGECFWCKERKWAIDESLK